MDPALVLAAHGTRSTQGLATTRAIAAAVAARRPQVPVALAYLDAAEPSLADTLDALGPAPAAVIPLLLAAGYHVQTDIPALAARHPAIRVSRHLGADPAVIEAVADRLAEVSRGESASTALAAIGSTHESARAEHAAAAAALAERLGRPVTPLPLTDRLAADVAQLPPPAEVATYLLAEGGFLAALRAAMTGRGVVAAPIGAHPALAALVWARYDDTAQ